MPGAAAGGSLDRVTATIEERPRHAPIGGNALRASVLGANDGLVSNLSLVRGVAGAGLESRVILITGVAGLLAGACSMAMSRQLAIGLAAAGATYLTGPWLAVSVGG